MSGSVDNSFSNFPAELAQGIKMLILDVDGVLTQGDIIMDNHGEESKAFNVRDGHGIKMLQRTGIEVAILTGRTSQVVECRARDLGIKYVVQGSLRKADGIKTLCEKAGIDAKSCAYMGDDVIDLPAMAQCSLSMAPADAHPGVLSKVHWVSGFKGGKGAVRQAAEALILANGCWSKVVQDAYGLTLEDCGWQPEH
jgi:3-deoxy-D-manno-octulosonate 8-phosphate phosphatase (KDO 8-P phosphatase)